MSLLCQLHIIAKQIASILRRHLGGQCYFFAKDKTGSSLFPFFRVITNVLLGIGYFSKLLETLFLDKFFWKFWLVLSKNHAFEKENAKFTAELSFSRNCKFVKPNHQTLEYLLTGKLPFKLLKTSFCVKSFWKFRWIMPKYHTCESNSGNVQKN